MKINPDIVNQVYRQKYENKSSDPVFCGVTHQHSSHLQLKIVRRSGG
jgi:hypothetical protein